MFNRLVGGYGLVAGGDIVSRYHSWLGEWRSHRGRKEAFRDGVGVGLGVWVPIRDSCSQYHAATQQIREEMGERNEKRERKRDLLLWRSCILPLLVMGTGI